MIQKILIAADHAGFELKQKLIAANPDLPWEDLGTDSLASVDYPDFSAKLCEKFIELSRGFPATSDPLGSRPMNSKTSLANAQELMPQSTGAGIIGLLVCGSGQGVAIKANRYPEIRAALCWNADVAKVSRAHNNANVLCLGSRFVEPSLAQEILKAFLGSAFEGGRHSQRVAKLC
jgi:ribose 5-phosphate isomerase B